MGWGSLRNVFTPLTSCLFESRLGPVAVLPANPDHPTAASGRGLGSWSQSPQPPGGGWGVRWQDPSAALASSASPSAVLEVLCHHPQCAEKQRTWSLCISALIFMISFFLLTLGFLISSFLSCFRCKVRLLFEFSLVSYGKPVLL